MERTLKKDKDKAEKEASKERRHERDPRRQIELLKSTRAGPFTLISHTISHTTIHPIQSVGGHSVECSCYLRNMEDTFRELALVQESTIS